jgi:hypothetical protein
MRRGALAVLVALIVAVVSVMVSADARATPDDKVVLYFFWGNGMSALRSGQAYSGGVRGAVSRARDPRLRGVGQRREPAVIRSYGRKIRLQTDGCSGILPRR